MRQWLLDLLFGPRLPATPADPQQRLEGLLLDTAHQLQQLADALPPGETTRRVNFLIMDLYEEYEKLVDSRKPQP